LPGGTSASFTPNPATDSSILSVSTTSSAKTGGYTLTVTGTSGGLTHSTTVLLQLKRK
jgi:hypothetical protein